MQVRNSVQHFAAESRLQLTTAPVHDFRPEGAGMLRLAAAW